MIFFNRYFDKNRLKTLVLWNLTRSGEKTTIDLVEELKDLGFHYATQAGLSLSIDDLKIPPTKAKLILDAEIIVQSSQKDYEIGNLTIVERFQQMIDIWHRTSEVLKQNVVQNFRSTDILNPVYMMAFSGARGNISQVRQLVGMRGLMADPQGQILEFPIRSNFREGLTLTEYVISCYGARKGLVDTALRTANSGYLTRRLVDVAQHIIVRHFDCGTKNGILVTDMKEGKKIILSVQKRIVGRVLAETIIASDNNPKKYVAYRNQDISPALAAKIVKLRTQVLVRSPLTCEIKNSICQLCYGWSLAHGSLVSLGEAVGVLAAQSIGEPGTQLTMRTFHTGGVFSGDVMQEIRSKNTGIIKFSSPLQGNLIRTLHGKIAFFTKIEGEFSIVEKNVPIISYQIPNSTILFARHLEKVEERQLLAEFSSFLTTNQQGIQAKFNLNSEKEGQVYFEKVLLVVKVGKEGDILKTALTFGSIWILAGKLYDSPRRSNFFVKSGDLINKNSIVNQLPFYLDGKGFLESFIPSTEKEIFFSKKIFALSLFNKEENNFSLFLVKKELDLLNQLITGNKNLYNILKNPQIRKENKTNAIIFKQPFCNLFIEEIHYKKFGYFLSLDTLTLFFANSLSLPTIQSNPISFQIFSNYTLKKSGILYSEQNNFKNQKGQYFISIQKFYNISKKLKSNSIKSKTTLKKKISKTLYLQNQNNLVSIENLQGNKQKIESKESQVLFLKNTFIDIDKNENILSFPKKIFFFKENPYRKNKGLKKILDTNLKIEKSLQKNQTTKIISNEENFIGKNGLSIEKRNFYKNCLIPYSIFNKRFKIRKNKLLVSLNKSRINSNESIRIQESSNLKNKIELKQKFTAIRCKLQFGWIILVKNISNFFFLHKSFLKPGQDRNFLKLDQASFRFKIISLKKDLYFFKKTDYLNKCRFINNKLVRINHFSGKIIEKQSTKKIIRPSIYIRNFYLQTKFLIFIERINEVNIRNKINKTSVLQKFTNNFSSFKFYKINSFSLNKQTITKLNSISQSIDIEIIYNFNKNKTIFSPPIISLSLQLQKKNSLQQIKPNLLFPLQFQFSTIQKIPLFNFLIPNSQNTEKIQLTRKKEIFESTPFTFNSFFSQYTGEIGNKKGLVLTNNDQISFKTGYKNSLIKIGHVVRDGEQLNLQTGIQESGQIIKIDKSKITLRKAQPILFSSKGVFHVDNGDLIQKNTPLITLFYQKLKTEDIVQGIPKIEELFEARQPKESELLQDNLHTKLHFFFNFYKQQYPSQEAVKKSIEKIQQILINNVQKVYQSQGVTIADKHIEIIVRQMTTKVKITKSGRTGLLRGELIDLEKVNLINIGTEAGLIYSFQIGLEKDKEKIKQSIKEEKAEYEPIILGITKAALETESFISASSFQETTRILSRAAIQRKTDFLIGLKENVILGHLIPAGTGFTRFFDPQEETQPIKKKLSWLSYTDVLKKFSKK